MEKNTEFKKNYHERSGLYYQKDKIFSKAGLVARVFPKFLPHYLYKKADNYYLMVHQDLWKNLKGYFNVLDVGCGSGELLLATPTNHKVTGTEIIKKEIKECGKKGLNVIKANLNKKMPFKDNSFDGIIMSHVIEHLDKPYKTLEELKRILKIGGRLIILTPNFATDYKNFYNDPTHKKPFTKRGLFKLLYDSEFKNIQIRNDIYNSHSVLFTLLNIFPKLKIIIGKMIQIFYGKSILAIAEKRI